MANQELDTIYDVPFEVTLNTDTVSYDVNAMEKDKPKNLLNNGIVRDGGLTEVYQQQPTLTNPSSVYHTSNGHTVHIDSVNHKTVYIDNVKQFDLLSDISFYEKFKIKGYGDVVISSTGTFLALKYTGAQFIFDEIDDTGTIINTKSCTFASNNKVIYSQVVFVDAPGPTFANTLYIAYSENRYFGSTSQIFSIDFATSTSTMIYSGIKIGSISCNVFSLIQAYKVGSGYIISADVSGPSDRPAYYSGSPTRFNGDYPPSPIFVSNAKACQFVVVFNNTSITTAFTLSGKSGCLQVYWPSNILYLVGEDFAGAGPYNSIWSVGWAAGLIVISPIFSTLTVGKSLCTSTQFGTFSQAYSADPSLVGSNTFGEFAQIDIPASSVGFGYPGPGGFSNVNIGFAPDSAHNILINTNVYLSIKNSSGSNAIIAISQAQANQGNSLCAVGDMFNMARCFTYTINSTSGKILFRTADGNYSYIRYGNDISYSYIEIDSGVVSISSISSHNIIDVNKKVFANNCNSFITSTFAPQNAVVGLSPTCTSVQSCSLSIFESNEYSQCFDLGEWLNVSVGYALTYAPNGNRFYSSNTIVSSYNYNNNSTGHDMDLIDIYINGRGKCIKGINSGSNLYYTTVLENGSLLPTSPQYTYVPSPYQLIPVNSGYDYREGVALLNNGSGIGVQGLANYDGTAGFLLQKYTASFRLFGQLYAFDGEYIYNLPLSAGSSGTVGTPVVVTVANGLRFLCATPQAAVFVSDYDNAVFTFNGGRDVERLLPMNLKGQILSAAYCTANEEIVFQTPTTLIFSRSGIMSELPAPYSPASNYVLQETPQAVWAVNLVTGSSTAYFYKAVAGGVIIPLKLQTSYYGFGSNRMKRVRRIVIRMLFASGTSSQVNIQWNWITDVANGTSATATITPATDANGYAIIDYIPTPAYVLGGSLTIFSTDATQKKVLLSITAMHHPDADAQTLNHAQ
jgi:hypothetical protein